MGDEGVALPVKKKNIVDYEKTGFDE